MIILLSPSKTLDTDSPYPAVKVTMPSFMAESEALIKQARKLSVDDLKSLMGISDKLAELNHARFKAWRAPFTEANARPAGFTFKGDVYDGLKFDQLGSKDRDYAQKHLRILSGLYGLLRPLDLMQPYRLEMGIKLSNQRGENLYHFWDTRITDAINDDAKASKNKAILNLASTEYFSAVKPKRLALPLITAHFKEKKGKELKVIGLMAKKARGRMAAWVIENRIANPEDLAGFTRDGYRFNKSLSGPADYVFTR